MHHATTKVCFLAPLDPMCGAFGSSIMHIPLSSNIHMWYPYHVYRQWQMNTICPIFFCLLSSKFMNQDETFRIMTSASSFPLNAWRSFSIPWERIWMVWRAPVSRDWQPSAARLRKRALRDALGSLGSWGPAWAMGRMSHSVNAWCWGIEHGMRSRYSKTCWVHKDTHS